MLIKRARELDLEINPEAELYEIEQAYFGDPENFALQETQQKLINKLSQCIDKIQKGLILEKLLHDATGIDTEEDLNQLKQSGIHELFSLSETSLKQLAEREAKLEALEARHKNLLELSNENLVEKYNLSPNLNMHIGFSIFLTLLSITVFGTAFYINSIEHNLSLSAIYWTFFGSLITFFIAVYMLINGLVNKIKFIKNRKERIKALANQFRGNSVQKVDALIEGISNLRFRLEKQTYRNGANQMLNKNAAENSKMMRDLEPYFKKIGN